jgi:hypothetical protein
MQPVSKQRLSKHVPHKQDAHKDTVTIETRVFLFGPPQGCKDSTWERKAEESPLFEAVARELLLKTQ